MQLADEKGDASKVHRLAREMGANGNNRPGTKVPHSIDGDVLVTEQQRLDAWTFFISHKFTPTGNTAPDPLHAEPLPPVVAEAACAPMLRVEVDQAVKWLAVDTPCQSTRRSGTMLGSPHRNIALLL